MQISRKSWHFRWMAWRGLQPWKCKTMCHYWAKLVGSILEALIKTVAIGAFLALALCAVAGIMWYMVVQPLMWLANMQSIGSLTVDDYEARTMARVMGVVLIGVAAMVSAVFVRVYLFKGASMLYTVYQDWRDNKCTQITFKD